MAMKFTTASLLSTATVIASVGTAASAKIYAEYNGAALLRNGFEFDDFASATGTQLGPIDLKVTTDVNGNGNFGGGVGADTSARFDTANTELQVRLIINPGNAVDTVAIALKDLDNAGAGDSFTYFFGLTGLPTGELVALSRPLSEAPGTVGTGGGLFPGDGIENYGLDQMFITAGYGGTSPVDLTLDSIRIVDPSNPTFFELDTETHEFSTKKGAFPFAFGALSGSAVDHSGENFIVNATTGTVGGGFGIAGLPNYEFEADSHELQVTAKLLGGNTVDAFRVVLGDVDGDDTGPGAGGENYFFDILTSSFNTDGFTTVTIPLGNGSQTDSGALSGFTNAGNDLQDFDLNAISFRVLGVEGDVLNMELATIAIVEAAVNEILGDYNDSGLVEQGDLDQVLQNWGQGFAGVPATWINQRPTEGIVDQAELDVVLQGWGSAAAPSFAGSNVPEPASLALLGLGGVALLRRRVA